MPTEELDKQKEEEQKREKEKNVWQDPNPSFGQFGKQNDWGNFDDGFGMSNDVCTEALDVCIDPSANLKNEICDEPSKINNLDIK